MKKKIIIFTKYCKEGASSNYRILMYQEDLQKKYKIFTCTFWNKKYIEQYMKDKKKYILNISIQYLYNVLRRLAEIFLLAPQCDVCIFQKSIIPYIPLTFIWYLHLFNTKVIYDIDDAISFEKHDISESIANKCDVVIVGNEYLYQKYTKLNSNICFLPTVDFTPEYKPLIKDTFNNKIIGWIGSQATIKNLDLIINPLNQIIKNYPEASFTYICNDDYGYCKKIKNAHFIKWEIHTYKDNMKDFTIGIMPLLNNSYNNGKCGFKLVQYMNLEKPVVASPIGANSQIVSNRGYCANSEEEWYDYIQKLLFDHKNYNNCVESIKRTFENDFSYEHNLKCLTEIVEKISAK